MTLDELFNVAVPMTGCESQNVNNHCGTGNGSNQLDCTSSGKPTTSC